MPRLLRRQAYGLAAPPPISTMAPPLIVKTGSKHSPRAAVRQLSVVR